MQQLDVPAIRTLVSYVMEHNPAMFFDGVTDAGCAPRPLHLRTGLKRQMLNGASAFDVGRCLVT